MATTERTRRFLHGVGSLVDIMPAGGRVERAKARCTRPLPDASQYVLAPADVRHSENLNLAAVLAWAEFLAHNPEAVPVHPGAVECLRATLDAAERTPPIVHRVSPVGNRWVDAVRLAEDRYRVRLRLVAQGRRLLARIDAARPTDG